MADDYDVNRTQVGDAIAQRISEDQGWVRIQHKTFTRWCNTFLSERLMEISSLETDLGDGVKFINLLEEISNKQVAKKYNKTPKIRAQKLENLSFCFQFLKQEKIKLVGMGPEDLCDGNLKLTLGLIWTLILRFQIERGDQNSSAKNALLEWVRSMIPEYDIKNFTSDWQSGKPIYALANACEPGVLDPNGLSDNALDNCTRAFQAANEKMGIPQVLDPVDMVESPDEHSNMLYINYFRDYLDKAKSREAEERLRRTAVAGNCRAYGPGLEGGEALVPTEFTIEAVNAKGQICPCGGHPFNVKIKGPKDAVDVQLQDNENGTYKVFYTPRESGTHSISVQLGDKHIPRSAFQVFINPAIADAAQTVAYGPGLEGGITGADAPFTVEVRNKLGNKIPAGGQNIGVKVKGPFAEIPANKTDNKDGTHSVTYRPLDVGDHTIEVTVDGKPIANSPFKVFVDAPDGAANWQNSYAAGPGLEDGNTTAEPAVYTIYTVDKNGNPVKTGGSPVSVEIIGPDGSPIDADVKDNNDGTYTVTYQPNEPGDYTVESILRNPFRPSSYEHIKNSPKTVHVEPGTDANNSYAHGPGLQNGILDTLPTYFTVQAVDKKGNNIKEGGDPFEVAVKDAKGNDVPINVKDNNDGTYTVEYKPNGPGDHQVDVKLKGKPIKGAPYKVGVKAGASAAYSVVENYTFTIQAKTAAGENRNEGGENFQVSIVGKNGPVDADLRDLGDGRYQVSYRLPEATGEYTVSVTVNGENIKGSPWKQIA